MPSIARVFRHFNHTRTRQDDIAERDVCSVHAERGVCSVYAERGVCSVYAEGVGWGGTVLLV